jgi:hypothetical protein
MRGSGKLYQVNEDNKTVYVTVNESLIHVTYIYLIGILTDEIGSSSVIQF